MMYNKRGWIRIVEAFVAVLLITGVALILINKGYFGKKDISEKIYDIQNSILREIELNDELRKDILTPDIRDNPINWEDELLFPVAVRNKIKERLIDYNYLTCRAKICRMDIICALDNYPTDKDVYAQSVAITATLQEIENEKGKYDPRQLKMFCWVN